MTMKTTLSAPAKLNLTLDILRRREDGYHDLCMVMQNISLCDEVTLEKNETGGITCASNWGHIPCDERNLAVKAAKAFFAYTEIPCEGLHITLEKKVPSGAGMAGGSTDAAAVLKGLRELYAPHLTRDELEMLGGQIGSDVPYCVRGGTALAEERGEILQDLPSMPACWFVICKPDFSVSTPMLFGRVKVDALQDRPHTEEMLRAIEAQDITRVAELCRNVFEEVLPEEFGEVLAIKKALLSQGALGAVMTGSGPTVFGIFRDKGKAEAAFEKLKDRYAETYLAEPV